MYIRKSAQNTLFVTLYKVKQQNALRTLSNHNTHG